MDRNSIIGILLIGSIMVAWMFLTAPSQEEIEKQKRQQDSIALVQSLEKQRTENIPGKGQASSVRSADTDTTSISLSDSAKAELKKNIYGAFVNAATGDNKYSIIENELVKISISNLGGRVASVELKKYKTSGGKPLILFDADSSRFALEFLAFSRGFSTDSLYFTPVGESFTANGNDSNHISMRLYAGDKSKYLEYQYSLKGNSYMVDFTINTVGLQDIIASNTNDLTLNWSMKIPSVEKSIENERAASTVYYKYLEDEVGNLSETEDEKQSLDGKIKWVALKQQFFTSVLIAESSFEKPTDISTTTDLSSSYVKNMSAELSIPYNSQENGSFPMKFYFGPNHYKTLQKYDLQLERQIPLGWGIFGWVNKYIVLTIFNFLSGFNLNYGIVILILTIVIKLVLFPIAFKTHLSSAKMRILKPEIDELNKKFEDPMKKQQATMALYKKAGVNPLAGCIPVLLQMPILIALFKFFPSSIELRQQGFLWATDLSTYDSILDLSFKIPFYGDHVSLFTLLMTVSTILYTYSNSQLMGTSNQMPGMKVVMYLMPIMFLGIFNNYSAGLSYYYFLANMITFGQTFLMQKLVNEDELHRKIQENKKKVVQPSKFQKRLEEMTKQRQEQMKRKN